MACEIPDDMITPMRAMVSDLIPAEPIDEIVSKGKFRISHYHENEHNQFDIIPTEKKYDDLFQLLETSMDVVEDNDIKLEHMPVLQEVVLAPKDNDRGLYYRAAVLKVMKVEGKVEVYFFDAGGCASVKIERLKPVTPEIMQVPILGYHVILKDVEPNNYLFTASVYVAFMEMIKDKDINVKLAEPIPKNRKQGFFTCKNLVIMHYEDESVFRPMDLGKDIEKLGIWAWERSATANANDDDVCEIRSHNNKDEEISTFALTKGAVYDAQVTRIPGLNSDDEFVRLAMLDDPVFRDYFNVLHRQLERYATKIKPSTFYPAYNELVLFRLDDTPEFRKTAKFCGKWCRGVRVDGNAIYLLDFDDYIPFIHIPPSKYEIRRLSTDFLQIPILTVHVYPVENGKRIPMEIVQERFKVGSRYKFKVLKENSSPGVTYDVELVCTKSKSP